VFFADRLGLAVSMGEFEVLAFSAGFLVFFGVGVGLAVLADGFGWLGCSSSFTVR
jgi:hypothetical protein